jgi:TonB family protein
MNIQSLALLGALCGPTLIASAAAVVPSPWPSYTVEPGMGFKHCSVTSEPPTQPNPAIALQVSKPTYPANALKEDISGYLDVSLMIDDVGVLQHVRVLCGSPRGYFESAVTEATRSWRFARPVDLGQSGPYEYVLRFRFDPATP